MEPEKARLKLKNLVSAAVADTSVTAAEKDIKVDAVGDDDLEIDADRRPIRSRLSPI